jgi:hypothetical protein
MGADSFFVRAEGKTAAEAFRAAVDEAQYQHGHGRYTGTIAEKHSFVMVPVPAGTEVRDYINVLWDAEGKKDVPASVRAASYILLDKWGPAACFADGPGRWIFAGLASS